MEAYRQADLERRLTTLKAQLEEARRVAKAMDKRRSVALKRVENARADVRQAWADMPCDYLDSELRGRLDRAEQLMLFAEENYIWSLAQESAIASQICKAVQDAYQH